MENMILLDLETQSFPVESGIYEVACFVIENYEIVERLYLGKEIKGYTGKKNYGFGFHDISRDEKYISQFKELINKYPYPIVAHNCPFDRKFLVYYDWIKEDYPVYCSMRAVRYADKTLSSYSLGFLVNHYDIAKDVEHNAMSDLIHTFELLKFVNPQTWIPIGTRIRITHSQRTKARSLEEIDLNINTTAILTGEIICFTGKSDYTRNTMHEIAIKNGADISDNVTLKTTLLVVGLDAGSKHSIAEEKGISIISDIEFMQMLDLVDFNIAFNG